MCCSLLRCTPDSAQYKDTCTCICTFLLVFVCFVGFFSVAAPAASGLKISNSRSAPASFRPPIFLMAIFLRARPPCMQQREAQSPVGQCRRHACMHVGAEALGLPCSDSILERVIVESVCVMKCTSLGRPFPPLVGKARRGHTRGKKAQIGESCENRFNTLQLNVLVGSRMGCQSEQLPANM